MSSPPPERRSRNSELIRLPWGLAWRLSLGQIVAWGILYYASPTPFRNSTLHSVRRQNDFTPARVRLRAWWPEFRRDISDPRFVDLALWFTAHAAAFTGLIFQIVPILQALRVDNATMLQAIAIIGPMQVLGRFLLTTRGSHFSTLRVGR